MSFLQTDPIVTQTSVVSHPNQQLLTRTTPSIPIDFPLYREKTPFFNPPATIQGIAEMEKPIQQMVWSTASLKDSVIFHIDLDYAFLELHAIKFGLNRQAYSNFDTIKISFRRTDQANYQGLLLAVFDPSPSDNYLNAIFGVTRDSKTEYQLKVFKEIEPKNVDDVEFEIPFHIPFEMIQMFNNPVANYHKFYSFGNIRVIVVDPLVTTNTKQSISYRTAVSLVNYKTVGNVFRD
uniref:Structural protein 1 n=1 Tax=Chipolycivirus sp. TaxID=2809300 RepID=A0AAU8JQQ9_9VIRU|nr:MAG: capsid protein [Picornavirales sp.]